jgi:hypothetical protein
MSLDVSSLAWNASSSIRYERATSGVVVGLIATLAANAIE